VTIEVVTGSPSSSRSSSKASSLNSANHRKRRHIDHLARATGENPRHQPERQPRQEFQRIHVTLKNAGAIGIWEEFVWAVTWCHIASHVTIVTQVPNRHVTSHHPIRVWRMWQWPDGREEREGWDPRWDKNQCDRKNVERPPSRPPPAEPLSARAPYCNIWKTAKAMPETVGTVIAVKTVMIQISCFDSLSIAHARVCLGCARWLTRASGACSYRKPGLDLESFGLRPGWQPLLWGSGADTDPKAARKRGIGLCPPGLSRRPRETGRGFDRREIANMRSDRQRRRPVTRRWRRSVAKRVIGLRQFRQCYRASS